MIMISFRSRRDKDEMIEKARKMEEFASEFVDCLENSESDYDEYYNERRYRMDDGDMQYRSTRMRGGRFSYNK